MGSGEAFTFNQRALPEAFDYLSVSSRVLNNKKDGCGVPAIGVAAYGLVLASKEADSKPLAERKQYIIKRANSLRVPDRLL